MNNSMLKSFVFLGSFIFSQQAFSALDPSAESIKLLINCGNETNCTTSTTELIDWVNTSRTNKNKPVAVKIGPGTFSMPTQGFFCHQSNNVSYSGSGRNITVLTGGGPSSIDGNIHNTVLNIKDCNNLSFDNMSIEADTWSNTASTGSQTAIGWDETPVGSNKRNTKSNWSNIDIKAGANGWYDNGGLHFFYGSSIQTQSKSTQDSTAAYYSQGGETWFYGGDIVTIHNSAAPFLVITGVLMNTGDMRIFGSSVRVIAKPNAGPVNPSIGFGGFLAISGGAIHMHGGILAVQARDMTTDQEVYSVATSSSFGAGGFIHTPGTAFTLSPGQNGIAYRIRPNGSESAESPFLWPSGKTLPELQSKTGADIFVETDCDNTGNCDTPSGPTHPHIMVYDLTCTSASGPWFDTTRGVCRGE